MCPKNLLNTVISKFSKTSEGKFTQFWSHVFGFIDELIRFWGQKVSGQGHGSRTHNRRRQSVEFNLVYALVTCKIKLFQSSSMSRLK